MRIATDHREAILQTAARLFGRKPFHEVLMDDIAEQTGIAKGTIYRFFPNKEELFAALAVRFLETLCHEVESRIVDDPIESMRRMIIRTTEVIEENHDFFQVMQRRECDVFERKSAEFMQRRTTLRDLYVKQILKAESAGLIVRPFAPESLADMIMGMVRNVLRFSNPVQPAAQVAEMIVHVFMNGLKPRAGENAAALPAPTRRRTKESARHAS